MAPLDPPKLPKIHTEEITVIGKVGALPRFEGLELKPVEDTVTQKLRESPSVAVTAKSEVFNLQPKTDPDSVALSPQSVSDGTTQVFFLEGAANMQAILEHFGIELTAAVKENLGFRELQLGLRPGELENPPVDLKELGRRRAQINWLTSNAQVILTAIYEGKPLQDPKGLGSTEINEIAEWAQWGKEMGIPKELVANVAVTHISRKLQGVGARDHRHTLHDITETVEFARGGAEQGGKDPAIGLSPKEKRAAFLASMDPNIARFFLSAKDEKGAPLFSPEEKFLYEQYSILRIFLENKGTPDPVNFMKLPQERDAFLSVIFPTTLKNEIQAEKVVTKAVKELLTIYPQMSEKEAETVIGSQEGELQYLAHQGAERLPSSLLEPWSEEIELTQEDLFLEGALTEVFGPEIADEVVSTEIYSRNSDSTGEFDTAEYTRVDPVQDPWEDEKTQLLDGLRRHERRSADREEAFDQEKTNVMDKPIELNLEDLLGVAPSDPAHMINREGQLYSIRAQHWIEGIRHDQGERVARREGTVKQVFKNNQRMVKVNLSIDEPQKINGNKVIMVDTVETFWMTPERAKELGILDPTPDQFWVVKALN